MLELLRFKGVLMNKFKGYIFLLLFCVVGNCFSQNSIKKDKQQTQFFYAQLNLHGGYINDINGNRWDLANRSPHNQLAFQYFGKRKKLLQKGYVKQLSLSAYKVRLSIPFIKGINDVGNKEAEFRVQLLDTWLKFDTKWDRTYFWIGNKGIPYGHNPKLDPVSDFMTNLTKMDYGFVQDLGMFFRTPISEKLDIEFSLTAGGWLSKPMLVCDNLLSSNNQSAKATVSFANYDYNNTWLASGRMGTPTFKKNEFGLIMASGKISNTLVKNDLLQINRLGADWVYKHKETVKLSNQLVFGYNTSAIEGNLTSFHSQTAVDVFLNGRVFVSTSFAYNYYNVSKLGSYHANYINANSITYSFSPHTRLRLNHYYSAVKEANEKQWGMFLQFVTGFGKRP